MLNIDATALEAFIEQRVRAAVTDALGARPEVDGWLDSAAAAEYLGVSRQRIHDLVCSGDLARVGEKGDLLAWVHPALVFADASAGVLASAGLDENRTPDVLAWGLRVLHRKPPLFRQTFLGEIGETVAA